MFTFLEIMRKKTSNPELLIIGLFKSYKAMVWLVNNSKDLELAPHIKTLKILIIVHFMRMEHWIQLGVLL